MYRRTLVVGVSVLVLLEFEGRHQVTAVEPCAGELAVLLRKAKAAGVTIRTIESRMADHSRDGTAHPATSGFTGIAYVLDAEVLVRSFRAAANALMPCAVRCSSF